MNIILTSLLLATLNVNATPSDSLSVSLEIDEPETGAKVLVGLHLVGAHGCASVTEKNEPVQYDIRVCRDEDKAGDKEAVLAFDIERVVSKEKGTEARRFKVKSRIAIGKKVTVGKWSSGGDKTMEIRAEVR